MMEEKCITKRRGLIAAVLGICLPVLVAGMAQPSNADSGRYLLDVTANTSAERTALAQTGVDVVGKSDLTTVQVVADKQQVAAVRATGLPVKYIGDFEQELSKLGKVDFTDRVPGQVGTQDFPSGYAGYHNFAETTAELQQTVRDHPNLARLTTIGNSFQGRALHLLKISNNPAVDQNKPEVFFTCNMHAREHLTVEQCLQIIKRYTDGYATNASIKTLVDSREIWFVPMVNPDGVEYDIATGSFRGWQEEPPGQRHRPQPQLRLPVGLLRRLERQLVVGAPTAARRRSPAPEAARIRDFVNSRVVGGVQQIKTHIDFHSFSELVLWPYGYTKADTDTGLNAERRTGVPDARPAHGRHQRLHAGAGERPLHHRRHHRRLDVGPAQDLVLHLRDVPEQRRPQRLLPA